MVKLLLWKWDLITFPNEFWFSITDTQKINTYFEIIVVGSGAPLDPERKQGPSLSYDDLRRKNRGDYSEVRQDPYR